MKEKEEAILNYQTLLKKDRDEHSLAAARMQEELKRLQNALIEQQKSQLMCVCIPESNVHNEFCLSGFKKIKKQKPNQTEQQSNNIFCKFTS